MEKALEDHRSNEYVGVRELADAAERILRELQPEQTKGTVSDYPNERTIRFYLSEGLLPAPTEKRGQSSLFRYRHLITLLVIKKLQSKGLPINVIKSTIAGRNIDELERILGERVMVFTDRNDLDAAIASSPKDESEEIIVVNDPKARADYLAFAAKEKNEAQEYLEELLLDTPNTNTDAESAQVLSLAASRYSSDKDLRPEGLRVPPKTTSNVRTWDRIEIAPGLELHLAEAFDLPRTAKELNLIVDAIEKVLKPK